ncbi:rho guanine nucleotide exchange factor 12-like isoform X2 [Phycodurus eques]|uniref:rho guanine nucleotide exchange factor 12-like isoform X2 n=1 Tax=Phycodurus eques TaxID=693459 RepID=UPI002ACE862D|nr:rho guanine nucleotide exchange factor 12-like isoform X2 [Phycodurus eques]
MLQVHKRTPSILNKDPPERKPKNDKCVSLRHEFDPTGLVQRCVIIQRDENGFGLTVSGDNPVFVQLVKEDGAAMRAGVQTGDRIIKVNGTLVTHSNHTEVVKLIKSGSYVALTVLGRPPGLPQIHLEEHEEDTVAEEEGNGQQSAENSPGEDRRGRASCSPEVLPHSSFLDGHGSTVSRNTKAEEGDGSASSPGDAVSDGLGSNSTSDTGTQCIVGSPPYLLNPQIIGAEDDYFDSQQEQINGQCSCFQSIDLVKCRPAHLAVFLHHVVSQFDPAPLLCFLYADIHKQTSAKESRRFFMEFHSLFVDRTANLKVPVPDAVAAELEKRRLELIPEDVCKQCTQTLQDSLMPDLHKNLDDFRQKRSMGLTLAEDELSRLDADVGKEPLCWERECSCAEHILSKIEDILLTSQPTEEEKCQTMQYVILTYMKHLGVKVKEPRGLEQKRARINFLPKIKKSIKPDKEGEEKAKKPRFPNILVPQRRLSRVDSTSAGKAVEVNKQRSPKLLPQAAFGIPDPPDSSPSNSGRIRGNHLSEGSDVLSASSTHSSPTALASDTSGQDSDTNVSPFCIQPRLSEALACGDNQDGVYSPTSTQFDFSPSNLEHLQEEGDHDAFRMEVQCAASAADVPSEDEQACEAAGEDDPLNWQSLVSRDVLSTLTPQEIKRQEVINELFYTERAHLRMLKVLDGVFYQRLSRDAILPPDDIKSIFTNLEDIIQLHVSFTEQMAAIRKRSETSVIGHIGEDLLAWFSGEEEEKIRRAVATFCSNQPSALELIKSKKKKDQRFTLFMQAAESNRLCRRLQLKDIIPVEMQRATKYPLLLEKIAKYTEDDDEADKVKKAGECCKQILNHVNQAVKEAENKQRLLDYQRRLDISSLKPNENPLILELRNLDLTKRKMVHEGPLSWKVNKDKRIDLYTLLLEDILVLLQKQDERLLLKFHSKNVATSAADSKLSFSPVIRLGTVLVRPVATNKKSFFVLSMSENGAQIYELTAQSVSDQRTWQCLITQCADAIKANSHSSDTPTTPTQGEQDAIEIINCEMDKPSKDGNDTSESSDIPAAPTTNPFNGSKSEDEEEADEEAEEEREEGAASVAERQQGEEEEREVDEEELEAFLDAQLEEDEDEEAEASSSSLGSPSSSSKAEEALRTLVMLKQLLFNHMMKDDSEDDEKKKKTPPCQPTSSPDEGPSAVCVDGGSCQSFRKGDTLTEANDALNPGGGCEVGEAEDGDGTDAMDMSKLLSSENGGRPNLSRRLMTHLRLLQADLQYLKEVELKYKELHGTPTDTPTDSDNDGLH